MPYANSTAYGQGNQPNHKLMSTIGFASYLQGGRRRSFLLSHQFSTHTLCMVFLARLFLGLCLLLFADTVATQSLGEVLPIK